MMFWIVGTSPCFKTREYREQVGSVACRLQSDTSALISKKNVNPTVLLTYTPYIFTYLPIPSFATMLLTIIPPRP